MKCSNLDRTLNISLLVTDPHPKYFFFANKTAAKYAFHLVEDTAESWLSCVVDQEHKCEQEHERKNMKKNTKMDTDMDRDRDMDMDTAGTPTL